MYILSLPVVLVFHSQTHITTEPSQIEQSDFTKVAVENSSNCQICNFYFDQELYVQNSFVFQPECFSIYSYQALSEIAISTSHKQQYLRGPPLV